MVACCTVMVSSRWLSRRSDVIHLLQFHKTAQRTLHTSSHRLFQDALFYCSGFSGTADAAGFPASGTGAVPTANGGLETTGCPPSPAFVAAVLTAACLAAAVWAGFLAGTAATDIFTSQSQQPYYLPIERLAATINHRVPGTVQNIHSSIPTLKPFLKDC